MIVSFLYKTFIHPNVRTMHQPPGNDEAHYDIAPSTERVIDWLAGFDQRQFVGTESRLMTVIALLREKPI